MKYLLLVLALQFTGLSFSIPRFTKLILTDLMSHPQSRFFVHLYLGMHGLIFNTSIWLLAGSTRYPIPTLYNSQTPQKAFLFCSSECFLTSCCAGFVTNTHTSALQSHQHTNHSPTVISLTTPPLLRLPWCPNHHHAFSLLLWSSHTHQLCDPLYKSKKRKSIEAKETTDWLVTSGRDTLCQVPLLCPSFYPP